VRKRGGLRLYDYRRGGVPDYSQSFGCRGRGWSDRGKGKGFKRGEETVHYGGTTDAVEKRGGKEKQLSPRKRRGRLMLPSPG